MTQVPISSETLIEFRSAVSQRYRLERELGQGGMAIVYLAHDIVNDCHVALKLLNPDLAASLGVERFLREIEVGKQLRHPNIVGVLDSGSADGKPYYTMPYIEGASLRDRLDREKQLPIDETIALAGQIAEALDYAHSQGVIHRDIKPENILLHDGRAMVADFGIARAVTLAGGSSLTRTGSAIGTPTYMSPEQPLGSKDVTPESDVYSLGCVIYELLVGEPPFSGTNALALLARHSLEKVPSLKIVRVTIPDAVEDAVIRAMAKVPADRFRTASAFAQALTDDAGAARRRRLSARQGRWKMLAAAIVIPFAVAAAWLARPNTRATQSTGAALARMPEPASAPATKPTLGPLRANGIAVLYLSDRSPTHSLEHIAQGLTEALIEDLRAAVGPRVTSQAGVRLFKGTVAGIDSIATALNVGVVVRGTVLPVGDKLRVTVHVIEASTSTDVASATILRPRSDGIALQQDLTREVSAALNAALGAQIPVLPTGESTRDNRAWEAYLRARLTVSQGDSLLAAGDVTAATSMLSRADQELGVVAAADPNWAAPAALQGMLNYRLARLDLARSDLTSVVARIDSGLVRVKRAVAASPKDADALEARGNLRYLQWLLALTPPGAEAVKALVAAEADLVAATTKNPSKASALNTLSHLYYYTDRTSEGNIVALKAYNADPYLSDINKTVMRLFQTALDLNDAQFAKQWCDEGARRFPDDLRFKECRLWLLTLPDPPKPPTADDIWKANDAFLAMDKVDKPEYAKRKGMMLAGIALVRAGLPDSARSVINRAQGNQTIDPAGDLIKLEAIARAQLGEKDEAITLLGRYLAAHPQQRFVEKGLDESWWFQSLQDDPRYKALVGAR